MISLATIATMFGCLEGGLAFDKDWEKDIYQKVVDLMLYGKLRQKKNNRKEMINFLRTENLTYACKLIHIFLFSMVMPRLGS